MEYWDEDDHEHYRELAQQGRWHTAPQGRTRASDGVAFGDRASQLVCIGLELTQEREQRIVDRGAQRRAYDRCRDMEVIGA